MSYRTEKLPKVPRGKKRYFFSTEVTSVQGWQEFYIDADSEEEARELLDQGEGEFSAEELEVYGLGDRWELNSVEGSEEE